MNPTITTKFTELPARAKGLIKAGSKHAKKGLATATLVGASLLPTTATAQDGSVSFTSNKPSLSVNEAAANELDAILNGSSTADLAGRTRINSSNSNRLTSQDTPFAPTIEAIASEVAEYGLLQTRQEKLDFAKRIESVAKEYVMEGTINDVSKFKLANYFAKGIEWAKSSDRDRYFEKDTVRDGYTRQRFLSALVNSPDFDESYGALSALAKGKTTVTEATDFNERLIENIKGASNQISQSTTSIEKFVVN